MDNSKTILELVTVERMALIDIHVPDETIINLLRRERSMRVGDGEVTDIQIIGERVTVTLEYEVTEQVLRDLALME